MIPDDMNTCSVCGELHHADAMHYLDEYEPLTELFGEEVLCQACRRCAEVLLFIQIDKGDCPFDTVRDMRSLTKENR